MLQAIVTRQCPQCGSENVVKNGHDYKGNQKYHCHDSQSYGTLHAQLDDVLELDELWSFVFKKANKRWGGAAGRGRTSRISLATVAKPVVFNSDDVFPGCTSAVIRSAIFGIHIRTCLRLTVIIPNALQLVDHADAPWRYLRKKRPQLTVLHAFVKFDHLIHKYLTACGVAPISHQPLFFQSRIEQLLIPIQLAAT